MDAVCGPDHWDVWLCNHGEETVAAMPYFFQDREGRRYITKAPLTQNNGIIFSHAHDASLVSRQKAEEKIINEACDYIAHLGIDVYEQQYHHTFKNWSPFYWHGYEAIPRYSYIIEDTSDIETVRAGLSSKLRGKIKKGWRSIDRIQELDPITFYNVHSKVFERQGLDCPFSREMWLRLWEATKKNDSGVTLGAITEKGEISSFIFLVWDNRSVYQILGGSTPSLQNLDTYDALIWHAICLASEFGLSYDFEGSMIERIAKSFREYGGVPKLYFRIRKVFNPRIILEEANRKIQDLGVL